MITKENKHMRRYFLSLIFLPLLIHCGKEQADPPPQSDLSFVYNGQTYSGNINGGPILDNYYRFSGIEIHSVFPGVLKYLIVPSGCAYLIPQGPYIPVGSDCIPQPGDPADSSKVYSYRSGSINYSFSNCKHKVGYDSGPGGVGRFEYDECLVTGTFSLTLANKNNEIIEIKNGSFTFYPVRK